MWVIIWTTITVVSILTNNAEGQVGSQSSNLPLTDTGDKKTGEEFFEQHDESLGGTSGLSFSASSYPHFSQRKYTYDDLRQLYRSIGCVSDEIRVECRHDANTTVVIENATFYAVPDDNWLNCSRGPLGPLAMGGLAESDHKGLQSSIFAGVSGFANLANARCLEYFFVDVSCCGP